MADSLTRGRCGPAEIRVKRGSKDLVLKAKRLPRSPRLLGYLTHDLPGPAFRLLSPNVAYLKISAANSKMLPGMLTKRRMLRVG
jgi:hypothetical protein